MNWRKWLDEFVLAGKGILLATKEKRFWCGFIPSFIFFGMLMNLLAGGTAKFELMAALGFPDSLQIIWDSFISIFGFNQPFLDWLPIFAISILQGILIGLIVLLWDKKKHNSANLESAGIVAGLIALGAGCPTCGATLITPLIGAIFSTGGLAIAGTVSTIVTVLAIIIAILSSKRLGEEVYVNIIAAKRQERESAQAKKLTHQAPEPTPNQKSSQKPSNAQHPSDKATKSTKDSKTTKSTEGPKTTKTPKSSRSTNSLSSTKAPKSTNQSTQKSSKQSNSTTSPKSTRKSKSTKSSFKK